MYRYLALCGLRKLWAGFDYPWETCCIAGAELTCKPDVGNHCTASVACEPNRICFVLKAPPMAYCGAHLTPCCTYRFSPGNSFKQAVAGTSIQKTCDVNTPEQQDM